MTAISVPRHQADLFVSIWHRHHKPTQGDIFRIAAIDADGIMVGIVQVGRPVARGYNGQAVCEATRLCTDGTRNACSFLYAAAARKARRMGYSKIITYILDTENGTSLRAAGWHKEADIRGHAWGCKSRPRSTSAPTCDKQRWAKDLHRPGVDAEGGWR